MIRTSVTLVVLAWTAAWATADDALPMGLVKEKPATGKYVKTDKGYMVPYQLTLPNSEIVFEMVPVPGGTFKMGSPSQEPGRNADEGPQVEVRVEPFWMGKHEVTWSEYKQFMNLYSILKEFETRGMRKVTEQNKGDAITAPTELYDPGITFSYGEEPRQPAVTMTQYAAKQYTKWLSGVYGHQYRLPAEAEWEYACRAGTKTRYHFGDDAKKLGEYAWFYDNADGAMQDVGKKKPNPFGLYDMHGNVCEWVLDQQLENGYQRLAGKKSVTAAESIAWPTKPYPRVVRGGSWDDDAKACRSAAKMGSNDVEWKSEDPNIPLSPWWYTTEPAHCVGFRLLRPLNELPKEKMGKYWEPDCEQIKMDVDARLEEGRGVLGLTDKDLPKAMKEVSP
ncbi:MAG: transcriptional regulator [Blastopirellula sp.]|nr:transcriptional regulator [Blastopirellula sp.]